MAVISPNSSIGGGDGLNTFGGYRIDSAFQPIFSMGHRRIVGFEALVRGRDENDELVSPAVLFENASNNSMQLVLDQVCQRVHVDNFSHEAPDNRWLFLNIDPATLHNKHYRDKFLPSVLEEAQFPFHRLVVEVLESPAVNEEDLFDAVDYFRSLGALVALDDFGAGRSNFDRIWRLAPDIIKLDRSLIWEAAKHTTGNLRRMLPNLVGMMHEAGSLVLIEGVETEDQLLIALDAEADFVQGYYLAHPEREFAPPDKSRSQLDQLGRKLATMHSRTMSEYQDALKPHIEEIRAVRGKFWPSNDLEQACQPLLNMDRVLRISILDEHGKELAAYLSKRNQLRPDQRFSPLVNTADGSWAQREYFRDAIKEPQRVQISRPYLSGTEGKMCVMLAISNSADPRRVFCCKLLLEDM